MTHVHTTHSRVVDDAGVFSSRLSFVSWQTPKFESAIIGNLCKLGWHARHCICMGKKPRKNRKFYFSSLECSYISLYHPNATSKLLEEREGRGWTRLT